MTTTSPSGPLFDTSATPLCPRCTNSLRRLTQLSDESHGRYYRCDDCDLGFILPAANDTVIEPPASRPHV